MAVPPPCYGHASPCENREFHRKPVTAAAAAAAAAAALCGDYEDYRIP